MKALKDKSLTVHTIAVSDKTGKLRLYIPYINDRLAPTQASFEHSDPNSDIRDVEVRTIDSFEFDDVDLIKIDVEGHEDKVILGAGTPLGAVNQYCL